MLLVDGTEYFKSFLFHLSLITSKNNVVCNGQSFGPWFFSGFNVCNLQKRTLLDVTNFLLLDLMVDYILYKC